MALRELKWHAVEKIWGRRDFPSAFGSQEDYNDPLGEVWFEDEVANDLLIKHLFTSERLSIQVHPDDEQAQASGFPCGKNEAWYILSAEPGARVGMGFEEELSSDDLRAASLDGSVVDLMTWHEVSPGDIFYIPAGTVHAIGAGLSVLEIQQNVDVTYRLYDYGRPRELQLDEALKASKPQPYVGQPQSELSDTREILVEGPKFVIERLSGQSTQRIQPDGPIWLMPIDGNCIANGIQLKTRSVSLTSKRLELYMGPEASMIVAYSGETALDY